MMDNAVSQPTKPPPITTFFSPNFTLPVRASVDVYTQFLSTPGILGFRGLEPQATITASKCPRLTSLIVQSFDKRTVTLER